MIKNWLINVFILVFSATSAAAEHNVILSDRERDQALQSPLASNRLQTQLDEISDSVRVKGNKQALLINGMMSYPARYALIKKAQRSIILSTFSIYSFKTKDGKIRDLHSRAMVDLLISKKQQGVEVLVIYDGATSTLAQSQPAVDKLRRNGVSVIKYNPIVTDGSELSLGLSVIPGTLRFLGNQNPINNRWHEKTLIVDGTYLISGGLNWGTLYATGNTFSSYQYSAKNFSSNPLMKEIGVKPQSSWGQIKPDSWRDTDILIKGPVATQAAKRLLQDYSLIELLQQKGRKGYKYKNASLSDISEAYSLYIQKYQPKSHLFYNPRFLDSEREDLMFDNQGYQSEPTVRYIYQRPYLHQELENSHQRISKYAQMNGLNYNKDNPSTFITNYYLNLIDKAQKQILWGCHSNRPTPEVLEALAKAAKRGVKVYIMGNSKAAATTLPESGKLMYPLAYCHYRKLLQAGQGNIRIFEWQRYVRMGNKNLTSGAFHSKVFSVDGIITSVGSYNMSMASYQKHTEGTFVVADPRFSRQAEKMFQGDLKFTKEVHLENLTKINIGKKCSNY